MSTRDFHENAIGDAVIAGVKAKPDPRRKVGGESLDHTFGPKPKEHAQ